MFHYHLSDTENNVSGSTYYKTIVTWNTERDATCSQSPDRAPSSYNYHSLPRLLTHWPLHQLFRPGWEGPVIIQ